MNHDTDINNLTSIEFKLNDSVPYSYSSIRYIRKVNHNLVHLSSKQVNCIIQNEHHAQQIINALQFGIEHDWFLKGENIKSDEELEAMERYNHNLEEL